MVNRDAKVIQNVKHNMLNYWKIQKFDAKIDLPSKQTTENYKNHNKVTINQFKIYCVLKGAFSYVDKRYEFTPFI